MQFPSSPSRHWIVSGDLFKTIKKNTYGDGYTVTYVYVESATTLNVSDPESLEERFETLLVCTTLELNTGYNAVTYNLRQVAKPHTDSMFDAMLSTSPPEVQGVWQQAVESARRELRSREDSVIRANDALEDLEAAFYRAVGG